jgi:hypothetical protein
VSPESDVQAAASQPTHDRRPAVRAAAAALTLAVMMPLFPALTPNWPWSQTFPILVLGGILAAAGVVVRLRERLTPFKLLLAGAFPLYALYTGNGLNLTSGDNAATRILPALFLARGTVDLSKTPPFDAPDLPYAGTRVGGRVLNAFPSGTALIALPHAALALLGSGGHVTPALVSRWDKHAAAVLCVAAAVLFFLAFRRWGDVQALGATALFALASPLPSSAAQSLWSFTGETFAVCLALWLLLRVPSLPAAAGFAMALGFACRPTALVLAVAIAVAIAVLDRRALVRYATALGAGVAFVAAAQFVVYGHPLGAYGAMNTVEGAFNTRVAPGLAGVLASPSRGLLVFCPWILLIPFGLRPAWRTDRTLFAWVVASLGASAGVILLASTHVMWWGGWSLGPRLVTEAAPFLALACVPLFRSTGPIRSVLFALFSFAAATQLLLAYNPAASDWNARVLDRVGPRSLWYTDNSQLAVAWGAGLKPAPAPPVTTPGGEELTGSIDEPAADATVAGRLRVRGWARIAGSDLDVTVYLDGVARTPAAAGRVPRQDVCGVIPSLGDCSSAGYEVVFDFGSADAGYHEILVVFRAPDGRMRRYPARPFVWNKD